jgi:hypothetical protein
MQIGYRGHAEIVSIQPGDSLFLTFRLKQTIIPISGSDAPLPDSSELELAGPLLPQLLREPPVLTLIAEHLALNVERDTLVVWVRWKPGVEDLVLRPNPAMRLVKECRDCVDRLSYTVEGGRLYTAGRPHLNVGIREGNSTHQLHFCATFAAPGDKVRWTCGGSPRKTVSVPYQREPDGSWRRVDLARR